MNNKIINNSETFKVVAYVNNYWSTLVKECKEDQDSLIKMPFSYVVPGGMFQEWYYWDSFFSVLGLRHNKKYHQLILNIVDNFLYCIEKFGFIPNGNRTYYLSRSQPPYLTSMIKIIFEINKDKMWLKRAFRLAVQEYQNCWLSDNHLTKIGLSRYFDSKKVNGHDADKEKMIWQGVKIGLEELAEAESGWDFTPRFVGLCTKICPIDLNCQLFKYEQDFQDLAKILNNGEEEEWLEKTEKRKKIIDKYFWDENQGLYFDYNFENGEKLSTKTLATFYPLWSKSASKEQAKKVVGNISLFEEAGGLVTCDQDYGQSNKQWNYPNGWAPLQWIAVQGLMNYGYIKEAKRIAEKWINLIVKVHKETGKLWEKYNVIDCSNECPGRYPNQEGFGWTNAIFIELLNVLEYLKVH